MTFVRSRIAVTGIGMVTGLGLDAVATTRRLMSGDVAIGPIRDTYHRCSRTPLVAEICEVRGDAYRDRSKSDWFAEMAAREALVQARMLGVGVELILGASTGATAEGISECATAEETSVAPLLSRMVHSPIGGSGHVLAASLGNVVDTTVLCSACSSGALAIAIGAMRLQQGATLAQLVGATDSLNLLTLSGFESLGAMSDEPCRPFDVHRMGLNLGEGAAFLVLETESMATARGAEVLVWLDGYAVGAEAHHLTHPEPEGHRAAGLIREALNRAGLSPNQIGYANAHGTATPANDEMESKALRRSLGNSVERVYVSSSKGQLGHTLAAAGAIEAAVTAQALIHQRLPPTQGLIEPAESCPLQHVTGASKALEYEAAISNSFGFGGACAVLAMQRADVARDQTSKVPMEAAEGPAMLEPIFVTGVVTLGARGILRGAENLELLDPSLRGTSTELPFDPLDMLVMERSRRFDRATALTSVGCSIALEDAGLPGFEASYAIEEESGNAIGLVVGNALGAVGRSAAFVERILKRGAKGANPAEFPHLLPSALSGNASIYAGLRGPVFNVSDRGSTVQRAVELGVVCVRARSSRAMLVGTTECRDEVIAAASKSGTIGESEASKQGDRSAWLVLEASSSASKRGARGCELADAGWYGLEDSDVDAPTRRRRRLPRGRSHVLWGAAIDLDASGILTDLGWSEVGLQQWPPALGEAWTHPAFALGAGASLVIAGKYDSVLVVTNSPRGLHWVQFRSVQG